MPQGKDARRRGRIEFFLSGDDLAYFDDLKGEMSRPALARILIGYALDDDNPGKALARHAQAAKRKRKQEIERRAKR